MVRRIVEEFASATESLKCKKLCFVFNYVYEVGTVSCFKVTGRSCQRYCSVFDTVPFV